jgi:trk system potassium uptake protein
VLIRPRREDLQIIGYYVGQILGALALVQVIPLAVAIAIGAWNDVSALLVGIALCVIVGRVTKLRLATSDELDWSHGLVTVALAWAAGTALMSVPMYLTGHFGSFVDAYLEMMSGLTATGLTIVQDLDHFSEPMNLLRHLTHFVGGQGIVIVMLTGMGSSSGQVSTLYVGEGRDDRVVPNIVRTARFLFLVAGVYSVVGTLTLWAVTLHAGLAPERALYHAVNLFVSAFDTGGFATMSTSAGYYHSLGVELSLMVLMIAGAFSFMLHYELWRGRIGVVRENLEVRTMAVTFVITSSILMIGLARAGTFTDPVALFRKGCVHHGLCPHQQRIHPQPLHTVRHRLGTHRAGRPAARPGPGRHGVLDGRRLKAMRIGLVAKSVIRDIQHAVQPDAAVVVTSYVHRHRRVLTDGAVRQAITILVLYMVMMLAGAMVGVYYGFPFEQALFDSTSAVVNGGMSVGVLSWDNPLPMKLTYIVQMWLGRLEFIAVIVLIGYVVAMVRGR